jgi:hypothetical protein
LIDRTNRSRGRLHWESETAARRARRHRPAVVVHPRSISDHDHRLGCNDEVTGRRFQSADLRKSIVFSPERPVQTSAFEIEDGRFLALYVVRNPDKLRYVSAAPAVP